MTNPATVEAAFGGAVEISDQESLSATSDVWRATVLDGERPIDAVVKRTWSDPAPLESWQRALVAAGVRVVAPLSESVLAYDGGDETRWTAYPRIDGRTWNGSAEDLGKAGAFLGEMHAASEGLVLDNFDEFE